MPAEQVDAVVIGAGVAGLAIARALALDGREVIVLESESTIGTGTSSRNSEVIHAGIYYPPGSLKAKLCVAGRRALEPQLACVAALESPSTGISGPDRRPGDRRPCTGAASRLTPFFPSDTLPRRHLGGGSS